MTNEELVKEIQLGHEVKENMSILWQQMEKLIHVIVRPFSTIYDCEFDDLLQESYFALVSAVNGFKPDKGYKFTTYLTYWVKSQAMRHINNHGYTKRIPVHLRIKIRKYRTLVASLGCVPSDQEVMDELELTKDQYKLLMSTLQTATCISLDAPVGTDEDSADLHQYLSDSKDFESTCIDTMRLSQIWAYVDELEDERRKFIIMQRYKENRQLKDIAVELKLSASRTEQLEKDALKMLKRMEKLQALAKEFDYTSYISYNGSIGAFKHKGSCVERVAMKHLELEDDYLKAMNEWEGLLNEL